MTRRVMHTVVVAYHGADELDGCLATLDEKSDVTVVDNSSSPAVKAVAEARGARYLDPGENLGFGAGVNLALRELGRDQLRDVLLLNPDAAIGRDDVGRLTRFLHASDNERVAAVSPRLVGDRGVQQRVAWPFPSPAGAWLEAACLGRRRKGPTFVIGAVLLLRAEAVAEVGLFDERFFLYAEETDWQRQALARGWRSAVCDDAVARHRGAGTSTDPRRREMMFHAAHETYIRKWHGRSGWWSYRCAACLGAAARTVALRGERRAEAARRARLYLRGPRRCAGLAKG